MQKEKFNNKSYATKSRNNETTYSDHNFSKLWRWFIEQVEMQYFYLTFYFGYIDEISNTHYE
jgi:hypothetical protein